MDPQISVKVRGINSVAKAMKDLGPAVEKRVVNAGVYEGAKEIRDEARRTAPRAQDHAAKFSKKSGKMLPPLHRAISLVRKRARGHVISAAVGVGTAYWGMFLEFGTSKMAARPWLRPAADAASGRAFVAASRRVRERLMVEVAKLAAKRAGR